MPIIGSATQEEKYLFVHEMAMAYMSQTDNSDLNPTEYYAKFKKVRAEFYRQIKDLNTPYEP